MAALLKQISLSAGNKKAGSAGSSMAEPEPEGKLTQEDVIGALPDPSPRSKFLRRRNLAVNQESVTAGPGASIYTRAILPKTDTELQCIFAAFRDKPLFAKLGDEQLQQVGK